MWYILIYYAENIAVVDGQTPIFPPTLEEDVELVPHNQLLAHLFHVLTGCQAMQRLHIAPGKNHTIHSLMESELPPP